MARQLKDTEELFDPDRQPIQPRCGSPNFTPDLTLPAAVGCVICSASDPRITLVAHFSAGCWSPSGRASDTGDPVNVRLRFQFLVPDYPDQISGRPARQNIDLLGLDYAAFAAEPGLWPRGSARAASLDERHGTMARTYSRVSAMSGWERDEGANWRWFTNAEIQDRGIIPGAICFLRRVGPQFAFRHYAFDRQLAGGRDANCAPSRPRSAFEGEPVSLDVISL